MFDKQRQSPNNAAFGDESLFEPGAAVPNLLDSESKCDPFVVLVMTLIVIRSLPCLRDASSPAAAVLLNPRVI